jgi:hypothetical protein
MNLYNLSKNKKMVEKTLYLYIISYKGFLLFEDGLEKNYTTIFFLLRFITYNLVNNETPKMNIYLR